MYNIISNRDYPFTPSNACVNQKTTLANAVPTIVINSEVNKKIKYWIQKAPGEISGLGVVKIEGSKLQIVDAILLPQKNSGSTTDIEATDVCKAMYKMRETPGVLSYWFHSHGSMGVFWSGTDRETINLISQGGWCVCSVFNKAGESLTLYSQSAPIPLVIDNINLGILPEPVTVNEAWDTEFDENVTSKNMVDLTQHFFKRSDSEWESLYESYMCHGDDFSQRKTESRDFLLEPGSIVNPVGNEDVEIGIVGENPGNLIMAAQQQLEMGFVDDQKMDLVPVPKKKCPPWLR